MTVDELASGEEIKSLRKQRSQQYIFEKTHNLLLPEKLEKGWILDKQLKDCAKIKKQKPVDEAFEDRLWVLFADLGFKYLNRDRKLNMSYSSNKKGLTKQIDVFAVDDETALFVECKTSLIPKKKSNFKTELEAINGNRVGLIGELKKMFPDKELRAKFIFATNGYVISPQDKERMKEFEIIHFDEEIINYYYDLYKHLRVSARYQLLGYLFSGTVVPELDNIVPAIEGKMGGHTYYTFSMEPEKLLKLGYVLHRNNANRDEMPAYQRLIKRPRLDSIREFVEGGGFFPNSILVNIDTNNRGLKFDRSSLQEKDTVSKLGLLHLPPKYKSIYIIDGQHRLYGYAESEYRRSNTIPVVAFLDLKKEEQIKLFVEINENQKAVPKNLRNTLEADLLYDSKDPTERREALSSRISMRLGEDGDSPLFDRVQIGENTKNQRNCITLDTIKISIIKGDFLNGYKKNELIKDGMLDKGNNDETMKILYPVISDSLQYIKEGLFEKWEKGEEDNNFVCINVAIYAYVTIINDLIQHLSKKGILLPKNSTSNEIVKELKYYLDPMITYLESLSVEKGMELRGKYGGGGKTRYWRTMQKAISDARTDFSPDGLEKYWKDNAKIYNEESYRMINDIETYMNEDFRKKLSEEYGDDWLKKGVPKNVFKEASELAFEKNYSKIEGQQTIEPWGCIFLTNYREIATYGSNWSKLFEKSYTRPGEDKGNISKDKKTSWIVDLNRIRNIVSHSNSGSVTEDDYKFLKEIWEWLI